MTTVTGSDGNEYLVDLTMYQYQQLAHQYAIYPPKAALPYVALGLAGEAGEIANKVKKIIRDAGGFVSPATKATLAAELGDVLWYVAEAASVLGVSLAEVASQNITKLADRQARNTLQGDGDER